MKKIIFLASGIFLVSIFSNAFAVIPETVLLATEGRNLLSGHEAGYGEKKVCTSKKSKKPICKTKIEWFNVALAVKKKDEPFKILEVDGSTCASNAKGFVTKCRKRGGKTNGVNTEFKIVSPKGYQVFAIRRVINSVDGYEEVVYTPYSNYFNTNEVSRFGKEYLDNLISEAYRDLSNHKVLSISNKNAMVHEVVPSKIIHHIVLVEHIDVTRFSTEPIQDLMKEVYVTLALNGSMAYNYSKSSADARGLLQVIPTTYDGVRATYPEANLMPDFIQGMRNHLNATKVAILLIDHDVGRIQDEKIRSKLPKRKEKYYDYVASSYNGGPRRAINILFDGLDHVQDNHNHENRVYVSKMRAVRDKPYQFNLALAR